jgi:saccharopine dehydrogenase-like NADP-dependent oxidoreductase
LSADGARVLIIGAGDVGLKIAKGLAETPALRHLILADLHCDHLVEPAAFLADCTGVGITIERVDGRDQGQVEALLKRVRADLIVQTAALIGPWATLGARRFEFEVRAAA